MSVKSGLKKQYKSSSHLDLRIHFHERFSTNKYPWHRWVFDHFDIPDSAKILEIGCGVGKLWTDNADRISSSWEITLSDFAEGMLTSTQKNLSEIESNFQYKHFGAEEIPFADASFDIVIANHMLYYPNLEIVLPEIRRVLKPSGKLYASSNGKGHLREIDDLVVQFRGGGPPIHSVFKNFSLDNGPDILRKIFPTSKVYMQKNALVVNDASALWAFCLSLTNANIPEHRREEFSQFVDQLLQKHEGELTIKMNSGLIVAT